MFNLEEFMCNEFLRPIENSCKWFNILEVMRRGAYIVRDGKSKISNKNNNMNQFNKRVNRFKPLYDILGKTRVLWRLIRIRIKLYRFKAAHDEDWYDSKYYESIQDRSETICDTTHWILRWHKVNRFNHSWINSNEVRNFFESIQAYVNRFMQRKHKTWQMICN